MDKLNLINESDSLPVHYELEHEHNIVTGIKKECLVKGHEKKKNKETIKINLQTTPKPKNDCETFVKKIKNNLISALID